MYKSPVFKTVLSFLLGENDRSVLPGEISDETSYLVEHRIEERRKQLVELNQKIVKDLDKWHGKNELPFDNMFPEGVLRLVIPFEANPEAIGILDKIKNKGYTIDFEKGMVSDGRRLTRLGKYILGRSNGFTEDEQNWFTHQGQALASLKEAARVSDYAIIVSRSPYDIARMSDHEIWTSCHSQGGSYFHCAVAEAKGGGPVAYVVKKRDLEGVDLQKKELFKDKQRSIEGIVPLERVRLRKFHNTVHDYDLAVPEVKLYGRDIPGFYESVANWAKKVQQEVLADDPRPSMDEFVLNGGSYKDSTSSELFNSFFEDTKDSGEVVWDGDESKNEALADRYDNECREVDDEYGRGNKFVYFNYEVEGDVPDGGVYFMYWGGASTFVPGSLVKPLPSYSGGDWNVRRALKKRIEELCDHLGISGVEDIEMGDTSQGGKDGVDIRLDIRDDDGGLDPRSYRTFARWLVSDVETEKDKFDQGMKALFVEEGYFAANHPASRALGHGEDVEAWDENRFTHFDWDTSDDRDVKHSHAIEVWLVNRTQYVDSNSIKIGSLPGFDYNRYHPYIDSSVPVYNTFKLIFLQRLHVFAEKAIASYNASVGKQKTFWGTEEVSKKLEFSSAYELQPDITLSVDDRHNVHLGMKFEINLSSEPQAAEEAIAFVDFVDDHFEDFARIASDVFEETIAPAYPSNRTEPAR